MEFSAVELEIAVELTSLLVCFMMDDDHHLDLDRISQVESISSAFFAILQACGACDFLLNVKLVWKAAATAIATVEAETGMDPAATIPTAAASYSIGPPRICAWTFARGDHWPLHSTQPGKVCGRPP